MEENRKIEQIPLKHDKDKKEEWWETEEGIDEFEKYINSDENNDIPAACCYSEKAMSALEKFVKESSEDVLKEIKDTKHSIKTVGELKEYLKNIPDDTEVFFHFNYEERKQNREKEKKRWNKKN